MESNTYTHEVETDGAGGEGPRRPGNRRSALTWGAVAAAGVAVAAFSVTTLTGGDHDGGTVTMRFDAQAEADERQAQLGQARDQRCSAAAPDTWAPDYLPGTRHVPTR